MRNVDEGLYRRVKALASLRGRTVGEELNDALATWLTQRTRVELLDRWDAPEKQAVANNRAFEKMRSDLLASHPGEYAVFASRKLVGVFRRKEQAYRAVSGLKGAQAIVANLKASEPHALEIGASLLQEVIG